MVRACGSAEGYRNDPSCKVPLTRVRCGKVRAVLQVLGVTAGLLVCLCVQRGISRAQVSVSMH